MDLRTAREASTAREDIVECRACGGKGRGSLGRREAERREARRGVIYCLRERAGVVRHKSHRDRQTSNPCARVLASAAFLRLFLWSLMSAHKRHTTLQSNPALELCNLYLGANPHLIPFPVQHEYCVQVQTPIQNGISSRPRWSWQ